MADKKKVSHQGSRAEDIVNFVINIEEQKERKKDRVLEVELVRTIISLHNLSHDIDGRLRTGEFTLITDSASLKITRLILRDEQQRERKRGKEQEGVVETNVWREKEIDNTTPRNFTYKIKLQSASN